MGAPIQKQPHSNLKRGNPAWTKGVSGNPGGRKRKEDCLLSCIKAELASTSANGVSTREQIIAKALMDAAERGNLKAIELVLEYTAIKPKTEASVEHNGGLTVNVISHIPRPEANGSS